MFAASTYFVLMEVQYFALSHASVCFLMLIIITITICHTADLLGVEWIFHLYSANMAYELSKFSSQLKEALYE